MKKIVAIMLALALVFAMSTVSFAAIQENNGSEDAEVKIVIKSDVFNAPTDPDDPDYPDGPGDPDDVNPDSKVAVYKVDIDASKAVFTYTFDSEYDTESHQYNKGSWDKLSAPITVTNHSNTAVKITADWKENGNSGSLNNVSATLSNKEFNLGSSVNTGTEENPVPSNDITVTIEDTVPSVYTGFTLDYVTVTIAGINMADVEP
ncbi:MAG: hypothetical protein J1F37_02620 [Oscillospiraceae bacterium]|nr:hypothetical protein [Oscillospiraceae bacterium]